MEASSPQPAGATAALAVRRPGWLIPAAWVAGRLAVAGVLLPFAIENIREWIDQFRFRTHDTDFLQYYLWSRQLLQHGGHSLYDEAVQRQVWSAFSADARFWPAPFPPPMAWLTAPLEPLPFHWALATWTLVLVACAVFVWWVVCPGGLLTKGVLLVAALALYPVSFAMELGQVNAVVMASIAACWWLLQRGHERAAGAVLAVLVLKPNLAILVPFALLVAGRRRVFASWVAACIPVVLLSALTVGPQGVIDYAHRLSDVERDPTRWYAHVNLTLNGLVLSPGSHTLRALQVAAVAATLLVAYLRRKDGIEIPIVAGLVGSLLLSPFLHLQDISGLLVAGWLYVRSRPPIWSLGLMVLGYLAMLRVYVRPDGSTPGGLHLIVLFEIVWLVSLIPTESRRSTRTTSEGRQGLAALG